MDIRDKNLSTQLPSYVNGTLSQAERAQVENQLAQAPHARAEAAWLSSIRDHIQAAPADQLPAADAGLDRLMARIAAEQSGKVVALPQRQVARWYKPALAIAASVILAQAFMLHSVVNEGPGADTIRALSGAPASAQPGDLLQVSFRQSATEAQIRSAIAAVEGEIIGGPGALGIYQVRVAGGKGKAAQAMLQQKAGIVDSVNAAVN